PPVVNLNGPVMVSVPVLLTLPSISPACWLTTSLRLSSAFSIAAGSPTIPPPILFCRDVHFVGSTVFAGISPPHIPDVLPYHLSQKISTGSSRLFSHFTCTYLLFFLYS